MLAEGLPKSLRKAVNKNRVPNDIGPDLLFLASLLDPLVEKIKAMAPDLPAKAKQAREQIEPAAEKAYKVRLLLSSPGRFYKAGAHLGWAISGLHFGAAKLRGISPLMTSLLSLVIKIVMQRSIWQEGSPGSLS